MKASLSVLLLTGICSINVFAQEAPKALSFSMKSIDGSDVQLDKYGDQVLVFVNVASKCGLTPQYEKLQSVQEKYAAQGLAVLGFPCNQFGGQEPGSADEIKSFCTRRYGVTFDLFSKIEVNGDDACPLYQYLTSLELEPKGAGDVDWNFEKFVVGRNGQVVARFPPRTAPDDPDFIAVIEKELAKQVKN